MRQTTKFWKARLDEKIAEWGWCIEYIAKLEGALQDILDYQPVCEGGCFGCPTCIARKVLGDMECEYTKRLGKGEDPRTFTMNCPHCVEDGGPEPIKE
jgi:hypothetical protein